MSAKLFRGSRGVSWRTGLPAIMLGAGIGIAAAIGPLGAHLINFRTSAHIENQFIGGEVASLGLVAPAAVAGGMLTARGHRLGPVLSMGPAMYAVYTYTTAIVGQEYARYPGNVEKFFPLYAALVAGGAITALRSWNQIDPLSLPVPSERLRKGLAGAFLSLGSFFALAWAAQIVSVLTGHQSDEYREGPTLFWTIKLLDYGFFIPLLMATGVGLIRRDPQATKAAYGLAPFATCMIVSIGGMGVAMELKGDPSANLGMLAIFTPIGLALAGLTGGLLRTLVRGAEGRHSCPRAGGSEQIASHFRGSKLS